MRRGIHGTGRRCLQRVVANGGNRAFIKGGKVKVLIAAPSGPELGLLGKALLFAKAIAPDLPDALRRWEGDGGGPAPATIEQQHEQTAKRAAAARKRKGSTE